MSGEFLVGVDVGTTSVKAGLFTLQGNQVEQVAIKYPTEQPDSVRVEQNPADWMSAISSALHTFLPVVGRGKLRSIGVTSQVNTHVFCDSGGKVLCPAIVWKDGRAAAQAASLDSSINDEQRMAWWGAPMPIDSSHVLARMLWMQEQCPALWQQTRHVLLPKDYCIWQLTGKLASDPWSNSGLVNTELEHVSALLDLLPGAQSLLPPLQDMTTVAGVVKDEWPFAGTPVAVGTMDAWAGVFGTGVSNNDESVYLSGTSEVLGIVSEKINPTPGVLVMPRSHDITMHIGPTQSGGASQLWFCRLFGIQPEEMAQLAAQHLKTNASVPLFLPHLQGERAPIWDSSARGIFIGLDDSTDIGAMARAVYEGVAYSSRWLLNSLRQSSGVEPQVINVGGGGFRSDTWNQIRADILGCKLNRVAVTDPGTLGAAGISAVAVGIHSSVQQAFDNLVSIDQSYEPDNTKTRQTADTLALFQETYNNTRDLSHRWLAL